MDEETKRFVRTRANERCEYCQIHQRIYPDFTFHIEHIVARQHGGRDETDNLALACHLCNSKKGPNLSSVDPDPGRQRAVSLRAEQIIAILERHQVRYLIIGGLAAVLHGSPIVTVDADICPAQDVENLRRLAQALKDLRARLRVEREPEGVAFDQLFQAAIEAGHGQDDFAVLSKLMR